MRRLDLLKFEFSATTGLRFGTRVRSFLCSRLKASQYWGCVRDTLEPDGGARRTAKTLPHPSKYKQHDRLPTPFSPLSGTVVIATYDFLFVRALRYHSYGLSIALLRLYLRYAYLRNYLLWKYPHQFSSLLPALNFSHNLLISSPSRR